DAGLTIDQDLGRLYAADLTARNVLVPLLVRDALAPFALALRLVHAEPGAKLFPGPFLLVLRVNDFAGFDREVLRVGLDSGADLLEQIIAGCLSRQECCRRLRWARGASAGAARWAELAFANVDDDVGRHQSENLGGDDRIDCALCRPKVLCRSLRCDTAVLADGHIDLVQLPGGE